VNPAERDQRAYSLAKEYLLQLRKEGVTPELLGKYLHFSEIGSRPDTIPGIYCRILESAQNANMKAGVIGGAIDGVHKLGRVLCDFCPTAVLEKYPGTWESVLDDIERQLQPRGKVRRTPRAIWPQYCKTILSAARFMTRFSTASDFYEWTDSFQQNVESRISLAKQLSGCIHGMGFALTCDFLKELGYEGYPKPDVHVKEIFMALELCATGVNDYEVFRAVARVAGNVGGTPYTVDRLFWLIGSGYFYADLHIGNNGRIGSHKKQFIAFARGALEIETKEKKGDSRGGAA
jgi:hypothetical protein